MKLSPYLPNRSKVPFALTVLVNGKPSTKAWKMFKPTQLIGGKTWSISFIRLSDMEKSND